MLALGKLLESQPDPPEFRHLLTYAQAGTPDEEWLSQVAAEPEQWVVVTADRGASKAGTGDPLPVVCRRLSITFITLSRGVHKRTNLEKARALIYVWPTIVAQVVTAPGGSEFRLNAHASGYVLQLRQPKSGKANPNVNAGGSS